VRYSQASRGRQVASTNRMKRVLPFIIIAVVLLGALAVMWKLTSGSRQASAPPPGATPPPGSLPPGATPAHVRGNPNAPVTVEEFADFQCPTCGAYYPELKKMEADFGEKLRVIYRQNPLYPNHQYSIIAAQAAEAAGLQGEDKFWAMHDKLFENQTTWSGAKDKDAAVAMFVEYAKQIGLNPDQFMRDLNGEAVAARIFQDGKRSHALGVEQTPSFYVNGKAAAGDSWKPDGVRKMINDALSAQ
jgi:protein-disulfide isomerase